MPVSEVELAVLETTLALLGDIPLAKRARRFIECVKDSSSISPEYLATMSRKACFSKLGSDPLFLGKEAQEFFSGKETSSDLSKASIQIMLATYADFLSCHVKKGDQLGDQALSMAFWLRQSVKRHDQIDGADMRDLIRKADQVDLLAVSCGQWLDLGLVDEWIESFDIALKDNVFLMFLQVGQVAQEWCQSGI